MEIEEIKKLCRKYDISPQKSKGQNFLICEEVLEEIIKASCLKKEDEVLEIGPGFGVLTEKLFQNVGKIVAIELDSNLIKMLKFKFAKQENLQLINGDILKLYNEYIKSLFHGKYKIIANLPYSITGHFLRKVFSISHKPSELVLMLQKEVAEKICEKPGKMSMLSFSIQYYADAGIEKIVPKECFYPTPEIDSAIIKITVKKEYLKNGKIDKNEKKIFQLAKIGFSSRRKMLKNNLYSGFKGRENITNDMIEKKLANCGLDSKIRAQDLAVSDWKKLFEEMKDLE